MRSVLATSMVLCFAGVVSADVLWDQPPNGDNNFKDLEYWDFPTYSCYMVNDVAVDSPGWNITEVTTYYTHGSGFWGPGMDARLNIFDKTGSLPGAGDDPMAGMLVEADLGGTVTVSVVGGITHVVASGLDIDLTPGGDYWIGLTPAAVWANYGSEFRLDSSPVIGDPTAWRNPGGGSGFGTGWFSLPPTGYSFEDASIRIEGTIIPEPASLGLFALGGLVLLRRR